MDTDNIYEVTVRVTDADDNTTTQAITVTVTDVRETGDAYHHGVVEATCRREYAVDLGATNGDRHAHRRRDLDEGRHRRRRLLPSTRQPGCCRWQRGTLKARRTRIRQRLRGDGQRSRMDGNTATKAITVTVTDVRESVRRLPSRGCRTRRSQRTTPWTSVQPT